MSTLQLLVTALLVASPDSGPGWEQAAKDDGITVFSRTKAGASINEMKATGLIDATPQEVWKVIRDYDNYTKNMPYTEYSKVLSSEQDGKVILFHSVINAPFVARRDYVIRMVDESDWQDGKGFLLVTWNTSDQGPKPKDGVVRVAINEGFWKLEPRAGGKWTFATYYVYTDPGGSLPKWIVNKANGGAVPDVFKAIRKVTAANKKK